MAKFEIRAWHPIESVHKTLVYDSSYSTLHWEDGTPVIQDALVQEDVQTPAKIEHGKKDLKTVKIQLGLSCNFECDYCNQRFVPHADATNPDDVQPFVDNMSTWFEGGKDGFGSGTCIEFWGGEPLVYWKTLKPLAEALRAKYPNAIFSMITNGSLLDDEKNAWLDQYGFAVSVSHDGPGQFVRGPDPLTDEDSKRAIINLFKILGPKGKMSFNSMVNSKNMSRAAIEKYFVEFVAKEIGEEYLQFLAIGEGTFVDAYDEGGVENSLKDGNEDIFYRTGALHELRSGEISRFTVVNMKVDNFIRSLYNGTRIESLPQKCGMDKSDEIALDLNGNVITCQNVSAVSTNPSGISHHVGHVSDLQNVKLNTATHWSDREECPNCPVIHICKGACLFLTGPLWETSCNNAYSDNILEFCVAIESLTGCIPEYIDGPLREDRKHLFSWTKGDNPNLRKGRKVIPIAAI